MAHGHKTGARTAGTPNKITTEIKANIAALVDDNFEQFSNDLKQLSPEKRVISYLKLLEFVLPRQREIAQTIESDVNIVRVNQNQEDYYSIV
jgi:hypothetical protein